MMSAGRVGLFAALVVLLAACGGNKASGNAKGPSKFTGVLRYYPLEPGMQWSFMLRENPSRPGLLVVTKVVAFDGG